MQLYNAHTGKNLAEVPRLVRMHSDERGMHSDEMRYAFQSLCLFVENPF